MHAENPHTHKTEIISNKVFTTSVKKESKQEKSLDTNISKTDVGIPEHVLKHNKKAKR